nr:hypothetical protein [Mycobacterium marinum]
MPVYLVESRQTSCPAAGCPCRDRTARYPWDLTDEQWNLLRSEVEAVMADSTGRRNTSMLEVLNGLSSAGSRPGDPAEAAIAGVASAVGARWFHNALM